jgi:hypothetical protein
MHHSLQVPRPCTVRSFVLMVTNSSADEGWIPMVESNCRLVAPDLSATAKPCMISAASGPTLQASTTTQHSLGADNKRMERGHVIAVPDSYSCDHHTISGAGRVHA